jgi:hypothetical protein
MNADETKARFDEVASRLWAVREDLHGLASELSRPDDKKALETIMTDLSWASESCTVIALHQIGQALDDHMGL